MKNLLIAFAFFFLGTLLSYAQPVEFFFPETCGLEGDTVSVDVRCLEFNNIIAMQMTFAWDTSMIKYAGISDFGLTYLTQASFGTTNASNGYLIMLWDDPTLSGYSLADSSVVFRISFLLKAPPGSETQLEITDTPVEIIFQNSAFELVEFSAEPGVICVLEGLLFSIDNITHPLCDASANGAINISINGGATPYTYSWSNGANTQDLSELGAGTYTVTILDASGNEYISDPITLENTSDLDATVSTSICGGDLNSATIVVSGGVEPYLINWSNGDVGPTAEGLSAGSYSVTVTDSAGCSVEGNFEIAAIPPLAIYATVQHVTCFGDDDGFIALQAQNGTGPYQFSWSTGATGPILQNLPPGTYSVTLTDSKGCQFSMDFEITEPDPIDFTIIVNTSAGSASVSNLAGGTPPYTYDWSNDGPEDPDNDEATVTGMADGTYSVTVTDAHDCSKSSTFSINSVEEVLDQVPVVIYPNPAQDFLIVEFADFLGETGPITIGGAEGKIHKTIALPSHPTILEIDISDLPAGSYWVQVGRFVLGFQKAP
jgi:hypothetical protein